MYIYLFIYVDTFIVIRSSVVIPFVRVAWNPQKFLQLKRDNIYLDDVGEKENEAAECKKYKQCERISRDKNRKLAVWMAGAIFGSKGMHSKYCQSKSFSPKREREREKANI